MKLLTLIIFCLLSMSMTALSKDDNDENLVLLNMICQNPAAPIKYDPVTHRYSIVVDEIVNGQKVAANYPMYFCPFSGTPLQSDKNVFFEVDKNLLNQVEEKLSNTTTLEDVKHIIGKPEYNLGPSMYFKGELLYTSLSKTTNIVIQQNNSTGKLSIAAFGKQIKND